jgi:hypothetical protein
MQHETAADRERIHLGRLKLAADVLLSESDTISDVLEAELSVFRDRVEQALLSLPSAVSPRVGPEA